MAPVVENASGAAKIDRKQLLKALGRVRPVVARRSLKPVLQCVHLEGAEGMPGNTRNYWKRQALTANRSGLVLAFQSGSRCAAIGSNPIARHLTP
jgi:hypothetical protein